MSALDMAKVPSALGGQAAPEARSTPAAAEPLGAPHPTPESKLLASPSDVVSAAFIERTFLSPQRDGTRASGESLPRTDSYDVDTTNASTTDDEVPVVARGASGVNTRGSDERAPGAPAQGDFWGRVVNAQTALQEQHQCPPGQALSLAIAWAIAASGVEPAPSARGPVAAKPGGAMAPSTSSAARTASSNTTAAPDLEQWVSQLHADLSERAARALVVAWEQRGSALRAASYDKG